MQGASSPVRQKCSPRPDSLPLAFYIMKKIAMRSNSKKWIDSIYLEAMMQNKQRATNNKLLSYLLKNNDLFLVTNTTLRSSLPLPHIRCVELCIIAVPTDTYADKIWHLRQNLF